MPKSSKLVYKKLISIQSEQLKEIQENWFKDIGLNHENSNVDFDVELAEGDWHLLGMVVEEAFVVSGNSESFSLCAGSSVNTLQMCSLTSCSGSVGVHPCQIPDHLGLESVAFVCGPPALPSFFFWQPCSQLHLGSQKTRPDAVPVAVCMSDVLPALCHSPFLTTLPLLNFFLV
ncbi:hypothetical protein P5673_018582, partial [Acropora cervicornis]